MIRSIILAGMSMLFLHAQHSPVKKDFVISFDGKSGYAEVPYSEKLNPENNFTIELWVKLNAWTNDFQTPLSSRDYLVGYNFYAVRFTKRWNAFVGSGVDWSVAAGPEVTLHEWTHLAMTYSNRVLSFYVNGILTGTVNTLLKQNTRAPLRFGMLNVDAAYHFNGSIDDVRIWKSARTRDQIVASMFDIADGSDTLLAANWNFNEEKGSTAQDVSGHGHDARMMTNARRDPSTVTSTRGLLTIPTSTISFPNTGVGGEMIQSFEISNKGNSPVTIESADIDAKEFFVDVPRSALLPDRTVRLNVRFIPQSKGKKQGIVRLRHSGLGRSILLYLSGTCEVPVITGVVPDSGKAGDVIRIEGDFFGSNVSTAGVLFGNTKAAIRSMSEHFIEAEIPYGIAQSKIVPLSVRIGMYSAVSKKPFRFVSSEQGAIGAASFGSAATFHTGGKPSAIVSADFNNDGRSDCAVLQPSSSSVAVWKNIFSGGAFDTTSLKREQDVKTLKNPGDMIAADLDNDGRTDLAVTNPDSGTVTIFRNISTQGAIVFDSAETFPARKGVREISAGDFDNNGQTDLIVTTFNASWIVVLQNTTAGGIFAFTPHVNGFWNLPLYISVGYLNDDLLPDIAVTNNLDRNVYVMKGIEEFNKPTFLGQDGYAAARMPGKVAFADMDGDSKPDLLSLDIANALYAYRNVSDSVSILFAEKMTFTTGEEPSDLAIGDLNGDGKPDIVIANRRNNSVSVFENRSGYSSFSPAMLSQNFNFTVGAAPVSVALADMDMDGKPDIVTVNANDHSISVLRNNVNTSRDWFMISFISLAGIVVVGGSGWFYTNRKWKQKVKELEQEKVIERERSRIARDMHDDLGARLTKISILLGVAQRDVKNTASMEEHISTLNDATRDVEQAMDEVIWSIDPKYDTLESLFNYIVQYAQEYIEPTDIRLRFEVPAEIPRCMITADERHTVFSIVKESLNNTVKYAEAEEVRIALVFLDGHIKISIADDGKGFDVNAIPDFHHGVKNMKERMTSMNGICTIESEAGKGTAVKIEFKK